MIDIKRPKNKTMESYIPKLTIEENENKENYERSEKEKQRMKVEKLSSCAATMTIIF